MARTDGPAKGMVVFTCTDEAISSAYIAEPLDLSSAEFAAMEAGGSFSGVLSTENGVKYATLSFGSVDTVVISDVLLGIGDNTDVTFGATLTGVPVILDTVEISAGAVTGTSDAAGTITGAGVVSGSVTTEGVVTITFSVAVATGVPVLISYSRGVSAV